MDETIVEKPVFENQDHSSKVKVFLTSLLYYDCSIRNCFLAKTLNNQFVLKQFPEGFSALREVPNIDNYVDSDERRDSGRTLTIDMEVTTRLRRRYKKRTLQLWNALFDTGVDLHISHKDIQVVSYLSKNVSTITPVEFREEYYIPMAYLKDDIPTGGNYLHLWEAGTAEAKKITRKSLKEQPAKEFFTGGCMFGYPLYGIDQSGNKHSLTNPHSEIPSHAKIHFIDSKYESHPDEIQNRESIENIIPLIKVFSNGLAKIRYHLPTPNYILYGVNWYLKGKMSSSALKSYIKIVKDRATYHKNFICMLSKEHKIEMMTSSTLDCLQLDRISEDDFINTLFRNLDIDCPVTDESSDLELTNARRRLFDAIFSRIASQPGNLGKVWKHLEKLKNEGDISNSANPNLLQINFLDYSANLAEAVDMHEDREVFSIWPSQESPITHWYKKLFAEEFGTAMCLHWLSPLQVHIEKYRDRIFYIEDCIDDINLILSKGLLKYNFLQVAAVALDSLELAEYSAKKIKNLIWTPKRALD